jgi:hypothetical protein
MALPRQLHLVPLNVDVEAAGVEPVTRHFLLQRIGGRFGAAEAQKLRAGVLDELKQSHGVASFDRPRSAVHANPDNENTTAEWTAASNSPSRSAEPVLAGLKR